MKRRLVFLSCVVAAALSMTSVGYAHSNDINLGSYLLNKQKNLKFRISMSAQTSLMNKDVYESALKWNNISSNVHVTIITETPGMPSIADTMGVYDGRGGNYNGSNIFKKDTELGYTQYFDSNGNQVGNSSSKISYVKILINTDTTAYDTLKNATQAASMNFIHEVGHALMLSHPIRNTALLNHTINGGYPYAVMNQGIPTSDFPQVSPTPTSHDKDCLKNKWGD